eukprot:3254498-Rhodomonas_salina.1
MRPSLLTHSLAHSHSLPHPRLPCSLPSTPRAASKRSLDLREALALPAAAALMGVTAVCRPCTRSRGGLGGRLLTTPSTPSRAPAYLNGRSPRSFYSRARALSLSLSRPL